MDKKTEALKLALEALESCSAGDYSTGHVIHPSFDVDAVNKAIDAVDEALAEQPPCKTGSQCTSKCEQCRYKYECDKAEQPAQPHKLADYELDGMHHNKPHKCKYPKCPYPCPDLPDCRDAEQPARKPWVGLTYGEVLEQKKDDPIQFYRAIEAKLKEKNA